MPKVTVGLFKSRLVIYFSWLLFIEALCLAFNAAQNLDLIWEYNLNWLDVVASYALGGIICVLEAFIMSLLLVATEHFGRRFLSRDATDLSKIIIGALFFVTLGTILYWTLYNIMPNEILRIIKPFVFPVSIILIVVVLLILVRFRKIFFNWLEETTGRFRVVSFLILIFSFVFSFYLPIKFLYNSNSAPISRIAPLQKPPNIIIIIVDALTADDMSLYGYHLPTTPNLERISQHWTVYENAHSNATSSLSIFPTIMTGRYAYLFQWYRYGDLAHTQPGWMDLSLILKTLGYQTIWRGFHTPGYYHLGNGIDRSFCIKGSAPLLTRMPFAYLGTFNKPPKVPFPYLFYHLDLFKERPGGADCDIYRAAGDYFKEVDAADHPPIFSYLHLPGVHGPEYPAGKYLGTFLPLEEGMADRASQNKVYGKYPLERQSDVDKLRLRYDEAILNVDYQLGELLKVLEQTSYYDDSLIIITADHGQTFTNGYTSHSTPNLSYGEHYIPLIVKFPGQKEGQRISALVSSIDIFPTVLDAARLAYPKDWIDGQSLPVSGMEKNYIGRVVFTQRNSYHDHGVLEFAAISDHLKLRRFDKAKPKSLFDKVMFMFIDQSIEPSTLFDLAKSPDKSIEPLPLEQANGLWDASDRYYARVRYLRSGGKILEAPPLGKGQ